MKIAAYLFTVLLVFNFSDSFANEAQPESLMQEQEEQVSASDYLSLFTVKVYNTTSDIFDPKLEGGHGTGYIVEKVKNNANVEVYRIFTNRHVIDVQSSDYVQNIAVTFHSHESNEAKLNATLVYKSSLHDFAVLEVPVSEVEKHGIRVTEAPLPWSKHDVNKEGAFANELNEFEKQMRESPDVFTKIKGATSIAIGNPFNGENVITKGSITAFQTNPMQGPYIQTDTAINPGNSGGPLVIPINKKTFVVVGMNTAIIKDANNVGYAIPIGVVMQEYARWKNKSTLSRIVGLDNFKLYTKEMGQYTGMDLRIKKHDPQFFEKNATFIYITNVTEPSVLKMHDILLKANGKKISTYYELLREVQSIDFKKTTSLNVEVIRNDKLEKLTLPLEVLKSLSKIKKELNLVYVTGSFFQEAPEGIETSIPSHIKTRVMVSNSIETPETKFAGRMAVIPRFSLISEIEVDGTRYPITTLNDLKKVLLLTSKESQILVHYYGAGFIQNVGFHVQENISIAKISTHEVFTSRDLSLREVKEKMDLSMAAKNPASRDWRSYIKLKSSLATKRNGCEGALATVTKYAK